MRIGHLAAAANTTPRAVRHYHRLGLLSEPPRRANGYRDYTMADLARLMRIRWLADSGVPLGAIAAILAGAQDDSGGGRTGDDPEARADVRDDLADLVARSAEQVDIARRRHERLVRMLDAADRGRPLSPLPPELVDLIAIAERECDGAELRALRRERDLVEVFALAGTLPDPIVDWSVRVLGDAGMRRAYRMLMRDWDRLEGREPGEVDQQITDLATRISTWIIDDPILLSAMGIGDPIGTATGGDGAADGDPPAFVPTAAQVFPDPAQRAVVERLAAQLRERAPS
ncbi:MerR family transcriptional regulator [Millisia brevis]|uniref:MerR family transcriptional regulator n=1 Tax=Millisia brevis TaxID=264148 RepID=UPI00083560A6|nr:MerR family transcriptional regulator [Millisia brevis]